MRRPTALLFALVFVWTAGAGETPSVDRHLKVLAPFVNDQTYLIAHIDLSKTKLEPFVAVLERIGVEKQELKQAQEGGSHWRDAVLAAGGKDVYLVKQWGQPFGELLILAPVSKDGDGHAVAKQLEQIPQLGAKIQDGVVVAGTRLCMEGLKNLKPQEVPALGKALAGAGNSAHKAVLLMPAVVRKAVAEIMPKLPKELGGADASIVTKNLVWAALSLDANDDIGAKLVIQAEDGKAARELADFTERALRHLVKESKLFADGAKLLPLLTPKVEGERLIITVREKEIMPHLAPLFVQLKRQAQEDVSANNLKQIALAMHNYHDAYKSLPAAANYSKDGKPLLSWRVHILPFVEQDALYKQFRLNEPWDSEHNKKLIDKMPQIYCPPQLKRQDGKTTYLVPVGDKTIFEGKKGMQFKDITDGTSNTIMTVDADESRAVVWTQPEDYKVNPKEPSAGLFRKGSDFATVGFADGSVRRFDRKLPPDTWRAIFTATGGEVVQWP